MKRQHHKGKKRPRSWHRSLSSTRRYYRLLMLVEKAEKRSCESG